MWVDDEFDLFSRAVCAAAKRGAVKVLMCGDRLWTDALTVRKWVAVLPPNALVIHGAARGADTIAGEVARQEGLEVEAHRADWDVLGKAAGPIRNREMLDRLPDFVVAFHADLSKSKGTADTVREARRRGILVYVVSGS